MKATFLLLFFYLETGICQDEILDMLNRVADEYETVAQRTGKFLLYNAHYDSIYNNGGIPNTAPPIHNPIVSEYDFIVVGSGSAGAALANRLSENPKWTVLLLEVGKEASFLSNIPSIAAALQFTDYNWGYLMERQENVCLGLDNQLMHWPHGRGLGGSTLINYMIHVRGNRLDYDRWAADGNPGWSYEDVLPYFKKLEDSNIKIADPGYHNRGGPISVEDARHRTRSVNYWVQSAIESGHPYVDYNGKDQMGVSYVQATTRRGVRSSAESAYIRGARGRPNLTVSVLSRATKLLINGNKKVVGVEFVRNRQYHTVRVKKEVILSAGSFNSPQLLMLSGIGPADHLRELGIPIVQDLPVGQKLYDHICFMGLTFTVNETMTLDFRDQTDPVSILNFVKYGYGALTNLGGVESLLYMKTNVSRDPEHYPDIEFIYLGGGFHTDAGLIYRKMFRVSDQVYNAIWKPLEGKQAWMVFPMLLHPYSVGYLRLKSKNPYHWPKFYGNYFTDPEGLDIKTFIAAIREVQRIAKSPTYQKFNTQQVKTPVPGCERYVFDSDPYWECALRHISATLHHQVATCKMGPPNDPEAVVDHKLKVYGVQGLRVADTSIIPRTLSAHTNVPGMMIGEKAADLLKEEWAEELHIVSPRLAEYHFK